MDGQLIPAGVFKNLFPKGDIRCQPLLNELLPNYGVDTLPRVSSFLAQCGHESANFTKFSENLNYSQDALLRVFGKYFDYNTASMYARNPEMIANRVYGNRMGNGPESSGDGWYFRGRGLIQLTGKNNYEAFGKYKGLTIDECVAYMNTLQGAVESALWYWENRKCNLPADSEDIMRQTKIINGGYNGLDHRISLYRKAKYLLTDTLGTGINFIKSIHNKPKIKLSNYLYRHDFESNPVKCGCGKDTADIILVKVMQKIKNELNRDIKIISANRCKKCNKLVNGIPDSQHLYYRAVDFEVPANHKEDRMSSIEIMKVIRSIFGKFVYAYTVNEYMVHLDTRSPKANKKEYKVSENFTRKDFECGCGCGYDTVDISLIYVLENIVGATNKDVIITSATRCDKYNSAVGGSKDSYHLEGKAADIQVIDMSADEIIKLIKEIYGELIYVNKVNFTKVHIDVRFI